VADQSKDEQSRALIQSLENSGYFEVQDFVPGDKDVIQAIDRGEARIGVIIPPNFASQVQRGEANVLILVDGSDSFNVQSGYGGASNITQQFALQLTRTRAANSGLHLSGLPITTLSRILYNPDNNSLTFILPGLVGVLIQMMSIGTAAMVVVRERENGTLEQMLSTPIRPIELMIAKLIPILILLGADLLMTIGLGVLWFGVPFRGDPLLFAFLALMFVVSSIGLGLLVSTLSHNQKQAQQFSQLFSLFSMMFTGFLYPIETMPAAIRWISSTLPLTYFLRISRGVITKGVGMEVISNDALVLMVYGMVILILSATSFRKRLD
jgi:ABC-2 type transport system permease protein